MNESERSAGIAELQSLARGPCGAVEASCRCELDRDHDSPHECACAGSWDTRNGFEVVRLPFIGDDSADGISFLLMGLEDFD